MRESGESRKEAPVQRHFQRPRDDRKNRKPGVSLDRLPALPTGEGHVDRHPLLDQGAVHRASQVDLLRGHEDSLSLIGWLHRLFWSRMF